MKLFLLISQGLFINRTKRILNINKELKLNFITGKIYLEIGLNIENNMIDFL
jgi:hypothetical protein